VTEGAREKELPRKDAPEPRPEPREELVARPRPGETRCPFCHESCSSSDPSCACAECLSRHHVRCWEENRSSCASCRATKRLEAVAVQDERVYGSAIDAWLKLALAYNGGLALVTLLFLNLRLLRDPEVIFPVLFGALVANACFLLGPAIELFARRFGYRGVALRWTLFSLGYAFAAFLTIGYCLSVVLK
jgi:hypothetical protein